MLKYWNEMKWNCNALLRDNHVVTQNHGAKVGVSKCSHGAHSHNQYILIMQDFRVLAFNTLYLRCSSIKVLKIYQTMVKVAYKRWSSPPIQNAQHKQRDILWVGFHVATLGSQYWLQSLKCESTITFEHAASPNELGISIMRGPHPPF